MPSAASRPGRSPAVCGRLDGSPDGASRSAATAARVLPQALQAEGASSNQYGHGSGAPAEVGGWTNPTTLVTYDGPVANDPATVTFTQGIGEADALRTGIYTKTLTFTLSTTNP